MRVERWGRYSIHFPKHSAMPGVFQKEIARKNFLEKKNPVISSTEIFWLSAVQKFFGKEEIFGKGKSNCRSE